MWRPVRRSLSEDRDGDGRPDLWRVYDRNGQLVEQDVDTNFDGRADVEEHYAHGVLVRRDSDRDFNGKVDLVEEFDVTTHQRARSVVDLDDDGSADLLLLFKHGRPVFSERAPRTPASLRLSAARAVRRSGPTGLTPLADPFDRDTAMRTIFAAAPGATWIAVPTAGGLPPSCVTAGGPVPAAACLPADPEPRLTRTLLVRSPRGPPLS
jgi:hypothetical protein